MSEQQTCTYRGYTARLTWRPGEPCWDLVHPEGGRVGVDGCVQYGNAVSGAGYEAARIDFRNTTDALIRDGRLPAVDGFGRVRKAERESEPTFQYEIWRG